MLFWKIDIYMLFLLRKIAYIWTCKKVYTIYVLKYVSQLRITSTMENQLHQEIRDSYIIVKTIWPLCDAVNWTYIHSRKTQNFSCIINCDTYFCIL